MPMDSSSRPRARHAAIITACAAAYVLLSLAALAFANGPASLPVFRPANGFLVGCLFVTPARRRAPYLAAAFAAGLAVRLSALPWDAALGYGLADLAEVCAGLWLISRLPGGTDFLGNLGGTVRFFLVAAIGSAAAGGALAATAAVFVFHAPWSPSFGSWFLAGAAGLATVVPGVLAWSGKEEAWETGRARRFEYAACAAISLGLGFTTFSQTGRLIAGLGHPLPHATFPLLLWAALRFGARGLAPILVALYAIAAGCTLRGYGPFLYGHSGPGPIVPLMSFPFGTAFCSLIPSTLFRRQKRIEAELRNRESRFGKLWTSKLAGIYTTRRDGTLVEANDTFLGMLGYTRADLEAGLNVWSLSPPESHARLADNFDLFDKAGFLGPFEREWKGKDGRKRISLSYVVGMDEPDLALGMIMDIQELKRTQEELRVRESRYRGLLSSSLLGVFVSDINGRVVEANDTFLSMIKRNRADLEAGRIDTADMATPEYRTGAEERRRRFQAEGRMGPFEREWVLADGGRVSSLFFATRLDSGEALCMVLDVEELKRTRLELRAVESRFKKLFDANIVGVAVMNGMQVFEEANSVFLSMTGYARSDLDTGRLTAYALRADSLHPPLGGTPDGNGAGAGKIAPQEIAWTRKDGSVLPAYRVVTRLDESDRWLVLAIDLTELKRARDELERARIAAEDASRAKSDFLAHMSHEIRTPLNGVLGMLSLLLDSDLDTQQARYARAARDSGAHLLALINPILDFAKIERGRLELENEPFSLAAVTDGAFTSVLEAARRKGLDLSIRLDPGLPDRLSGDPVRLRQVLLNLLGNAVKFSDRGRVRLEAKLEARDAETCRIGFEVSDEGPGMSPATVSHLFQPFRQGDDSSARRSGGTGLGLAISRELVRMMGGDIEVETRPGAGSRFRFSISAGIPATGEGDPGGPADPARPAWPRPPRVLVVDDHPVNLTVASALLRRLGCEVETASGGAAALEAARDARFDVIFMDCQMPEMDGFETTRRLRAQEAPGRRVPIAALTAQAIADVRERCLAEGMDDFIVKPFAAPDLLRVLRAWVREDDARPEPPRTEDYGGSGWSAAIPILDPERLAALDDGTPEGGENIRRLADLFMTTTRASLASIHESQRANDTEALAKALHRLKGSCATLGAEAMAVRLRAMEGRLRAEGSAALVSDLEALENTVAETERALRRRFRA
jgi:PAS domain S-box-containing protein